MTLKYYVNQHIGERIVGTSDKNNSVIKKKNNSYRLIGPLFFFLLVKITKFQDYNLTGYAYYYRL